MIPDIVTALDHPGLFLPWFNGPSWGNWRTVIKAANGLPVMAEEREFFKTISGGREPPRRRVRELWGVIGRGGGKDSTASAIAAHAAASFDPSVLRPGERALVACVAPDKATGQIIWRYIEAFFQDIPPLAAMVERKAESDGIIKLTNSVDICVMTKDFRSIRG